MSISEKDLEKIHACGFDLATEIEKAKEIEAEDEALSPTIVTPRARADLRMEKMKSRHLGFFFLFSIFV